jgi:transcriptional regulator with XRE-family HTH domain
MSTKQTGFPANLKSLREKAEESQQALAVALGIAVATVSRWERGIAEPEGLESYRRIAAHFGVTVSDLLKGE